MSRIDPHARSNADASSRTRRARGALPVDVAASSAALLAKSSLSAAEGERFTAMVARKHGLLLRIARKGIGRTLRGRVSEDDVVQDTMAKVLTAITSMHRHLLDDEMQFESFFVIALQNHVKEVHTAHRRQRRDARRDKSLADVGSSTEEPSTPSTRSPSRTLGRKEVADKLRREVDGLGAVDRKIVLGRAIDDKSYPELGREVGLSSEATRKRFVRVWARIAPRVRGWLGLPPAKKSR